MWATNDEEKSKIVSEIIPWFKIKLIPRANPIINDTPTKLEAPLTNASTTPFSPIPFLPVAVKIMIKMAKAKNEAAILGNHQPWVITPQTINGKPATNSANTIFFRKVNAACCSSLFITDHFWLNSSRSS